MRPGGPCQGPGSTAGTICGVTAILHSASWRKGGKYIPEHQGKACCPKRRCRIYLGVIEDTNSPAAAPQPPPAEQVLPQPPPPPVPHPPPPPQPQPQPQPPPKPPPPPCLGDATLHVALPYGLTTPPSLLPSLPPTASSPTAPGSAAASADGESGSGWMSEDASEQDDDIFAELATLMGGMHRPKFTDVSECVGDLRNLYVDECNAHAQKVEHLKDQIAVLQVALALTLTSNQKSALRSARSMEWTDTSAFEAALKAELARHNAHV